MSEEVAAAPVETKPTTNTPHERAPRIDFHAMSIEELKAYLEKPLEKVPMPSKKTMEETVAKIEADIARHCFFFQIMIKELEHTFLKIYFVGNLCRPMRFACIVQHPEERLMVLL